MSSMISWLLFFLFIAFLCILFFVFLTLMNQTLTVYSCMYDNTKGVVFYSTPHLGSALASYSSQARHLILPSVEVKELCQSKWFFLFFSLFDEYKKLLLSATNCLGSVVRWVLYGKKRRSGPRPHSLTNADLFIVSYRQLKKRYNIVQGVVGKGKALISSFEVGRVCKFY